MRIKICGITKPEQGRAIAQLGATALGFICVRSSPRYVTPEQIRRIVEALPVEALPSASAHSFHGSAGMVDRVGVFADAALDEIASIVAMSGLNAVQLHGDESPEFCGQVRDLLPQVEVIKALRVRDRQTLHQCDRYQSQVNTLLLDAYHPTLLGGTGHTLNWESLQSFTFSRPWLLAGGLTPDNVAAALAQLHPEGIDLSSGVETAPGDKDLQQVARLMETLHQL